MKKEFKNNIWEDLSILSFGKSKYRAEYDDAKRNIFDLNGEWAFKYLKSPLISDEEFYKNEYDSSKWDKMPVPGCWEMNGFGKPAYENVTYHVSFKPPYVVSDNPTGLYIKTIKVDIKKQKQYILRMKGVDSACQIWVNGEYVGYNKHARVTGEFDITKWLIDGQNKISFKVFQFTDQTFLEDQDMWVFAGIFREVELLEESVDGINDYQLFQDFSDDLKQVNLSVDVSLRGNLNESSKVTLKDPSGKVVVEKEVEFKNGKLEICEVQNPLLWSAETPHLYTLEIVNNSQHIIEKVGFRKVEIRGKVFYANNVAIKFKGVNRHDFSPTGGRVVNTAEMLDDIKLMKQHNINAIRTSHYPSKYELYKMCDEYGIWVMEEADLESHGAQYAGNWGFMAENPEWEIHYVEKGKQMVNRTKNRPCIFSYSLGNEAGMGVNFVKMAEYIKSKNTNTIIHYEGDVDCIVSEVNSSMYTWIEKENVFRNGIRCFDDWKNGIQRGTKNEIWKNIPHIECEYAHAMGNGPGSLKDFWDLWYSDDRYMGGFVWEWYDHGIKSEKNDDYLYGGDFGEIKHDSSFCIDGLLFPNRKPSPGLTELKEVYSPILLEIKNDALNITNRYHFVQPNTKAKLVFTEVDVNGKELNRKELNIPEMKYLQTTQISLPKFINDFSIVKVEIHALNPKEHGDDLVIGATSAYNNIALIEKGASNTKTDFIERSESWDLESGKTKIHVSKIDGSISISKNNKIIISNANKFSMWRPPIDNDERGPYFHKWSVDFSLRITHSIVREIKHENNKLTVKQFVGTPNTAWGFELEHVYSFIGNNKVHVETKGHPYFSITISDKPQWNDGGEKTMQVKENVYPHFIPKIGFRFELPKGMDKVQYIGKGPGENYLDSAQANALGVFNTSVDNLWTNYVKPQGNGNRMDVSKLEISDGKQSVKFISAKTFNFSVSRYSDIAVEKANHPSDLLMDDKVNLNIDYKQSGLGSRACGPAQLTKDMCKLEEFSMDYKIIID